MISWILLLILLISCVCAGALEVKVSQPLYQAEENNSVTLEWKFTTEPDRSTNSLSIICDQTTDQKDSKILYHLHKGSEVQRSQDEQFSGRVQCDGDVLREGRLRLQVSRLRNEDSGQYMCEVNRNNDGNFGKCQLIVIAADQPKPQRPTVTSQPERGFRYCITVIVIVAAALTVAVITAAVLVKLSSASRCAYRKSIGKTEEHLAGETLHHPEWGLLSAPAPCYPVSL
nr:PREDICTED: uncharacterized protein LOC109644776 isoform X2 [Paralichthys olivaceus]